MGTAFISSLLAKSSAAYGLSATMGIGALFCCGYLSFVLGFVTLLSWYGCHFKDPVYEHVASDSPKRSSSYLLSRCSKHPILRWFFDTKLLLLFSALSIYAFGFSAPMMNLPQFAKDRGISAVDAAGLLSVFGIFNAVGRLFFSQIGDVLGPIKVFSFLVFGNGISVLLLPFCWSYASFVVFSVFCGLVAGGRTGILSLVCCQLFGQHDASRVYALACLPFAISQTIGAPVVAMLHDQTDSYRQGFFLVGSLMIIAWFVCMVLVRRHSRDVKAHCLARVGTAADVGKSAEPSGD